MDLVTCPECGATVSDLAKSCIRCGAPIVKKQNTEKSFSVRSLFLIIAIVLFAAAIVVTVGFLIKTAPYNKSSKSGTTLSEDVNSVSNDVAVENVAEPTEPESIIVQEAETETTVTPETPESSVTQTDIQAVELSDNEFLCGNLIFAIPEGFEIIKQDEVYTCISNDDGTCVIGFVAADIAQLDEEKTKLYLPMQHDAFLEEGIIRVSAGDLESQIAGFAVIIDAYGNANVNPWTMNMDTSFTDSWYAYTILYRCEGESELLDQYNLMFIDMTIGAKHNGKPARFDYVQ